MRNKFYLSLFAVICVAAALAAWFPLWAQDTEHTLYLPFISGAQVGAQNPTEEQPVQAPSVASACAAIQPTQPTPSVDAFFSAAAAAHVQALAGVDKANIQQQLDLTSGEHLLLLRDDTYQVVLPDDSVSRALPIHREIKLRAQTFDPLATDSPAAMVSATSALSRQTNDVYIVQFVSQPLQAYRDAITQLGGEVFIYVPEQAHLVRMDRNVLRAVCALPYVRWVGPYYAAYKVDQAIAQAELQSAAAPPARYSMMLLARGPAMQEGVATRIAGLGGQVELLNPAGYRIEATLTPAQLAQVLQLGEVLFVDRWGAPESDTDLVREIGGANYLQGVGNYQGQGVRGEVFDLGLYEQHAEFQARPPILRSDGPDDAHGTVVYGILFGSQIGVLPKAQGIFANYNSLLGNPGARYAHTAALVDPNGPYRAVFQSNSWGYPNTTEYTTYSAQMDDILFQYDIATLNSMSNNGTREARPQAWAKNIVAVGAFRHYNNSDPNDDRWAGTASIGPAADGRVKPDLSFFYDEIRSTNNTGGYANYSGTSVATPSTAGYFGLFFQLWADGVFAGTPGLNRDVFAARPHMTTAKAVMINTAYQYPFSGTTADMTRVHQGWGRVDIRNAYDLALNGHMPLIVDETNVINPFETHDYHFTVQANRCAVRATLVYADPMGNPAARQHRINDLSLKLISPSGTSYWGNNGLLAGNWSTPGGRSNRIDTVENVFLNNAEPGTWQVQVLADEIVQDGHVETGKLDADYALVVSGDCVTQAQGGTVFALVNPGDQSNTVKERVKLPMPVNGAGNGRLIYTATGLPDGLVIRRRTGIIAGKVTTVGTFNVTVQVRDTNNHTDSTSFLWTIHPRSSDNTPPVSNKPAVRIHAGKIGGNINLSANSQLLPTRNALLDTRNFGPTGTVQVTSLTIVDAVATLTAADLQNVDILFDGWVANSEWTQAELDLVTAWVQAGGVLLSANDNATYDLLAEQYGVAATLNGTPTWTAVDPSHPIVTGPFGTWGTIQGLGWISTLREPVGWQVLARDEYNRATMMEKSVGQGFVILTGDEGIFRNNWVAGGNQTMALNLFAHAIQQIGATSNQAAAAAVVEVVPTAGHQAQALGPVPVEHVAEIFLPDIHR